MKKRNQLVMRIWGGRYSIQSGGRGRADEDHEKSDVFQHIDKFGGSGSVTNDNEQDWMLHAGLGAIARQLIRQIGDSERLLVMPFPRVRGL